jgi:dTDP-4-dehydrorhamnose reductase
MKALFTGLNGTVAPAVANYFKKQEYQIIPYDRSVIPVDQPIEIMNFIKLHQPDVILHFAMGSPEWARILAEISLHENIKFVYISTVSVYGPETKGPITIDIKPNASDQYGQYKIISEQAVMKANPNAYILRIGWQIGTSPGSNNMIDYLDKQITQYGLIQASKNWYPSCSFLEDTAESIYDTIHRLNPDIYLLNSNDRYHFYDIVRILSTIHPSFKVVEQNEFIQNNQMIDERVKIKKLSERFSSIKL